MKLEPGTYHWCSCGRSAKEPLCDGSHTGTGKEPVPFEVTENKHVGLCGCGRTKKQPFCDGSHAR
jgi:CDGSH-type Zn-finger protein